MGQLVLGILASGRGSNYLAIQKAIDQGELAAKVAIVITDKPNAGVLSLTGSTPACCINPKEYASKHDFEQALADKLKEYGVELVVLAGFMRILTADFIQNFPGRILNIHPALLPSFPGLDAQGQAVRYGVKVSGCTVHFVDEGMDTGPIILQTPVPVLPTDTGETLAARILVAEHDTYKQAIAMFASGQLEIKGSQVIFKNEGVK